MREFKNIFCVICDDVISSKQFYNTPHGKMCEKHYAAYKRNGDEIYSYRYRPNNFKLDMGLCTIEIKHKGEWFDVLIDEDDYEKCKQFKWYIGSSGKHRKYYAYSVSRIDGKRRVFALHRFIMGEPIGKEIDHINHNGLDNRRCNLSIVSKQQNRQNMRIPSNNKTGHVGVNYNERLNKYIAKIQHKGKTIHIGCYQNIDDAVKARKDKEAELWEYKNMISV